MANISIEQFKEIDLRVARITAAERVEGTDKLLKLQLDLGDEQRQIVSGIAEKYAPEDIVGREIIVVYNLEPKSLKGVESQGMLLAASGDGFISLLAPDQEVPPGTRIH